ncbi:PfkB family carbohydrate kinase, partial [Streptomyces pathocidini]|uniref:PfkB family carbohydrate kinase n=1 Tax=Streptomyces pathocidini TaxID=1650571 RepID=UPI001F0A2F97
MILTVTLNAALDITYRVPSLRARTAHRVAEVAERAGGKGLNVARVLAALGHRAVVAGFAGGATGEALRGLMAADGAEAFPRASRASGASPAAEASGASKAADNDAAPLLT